MNEKSFNRDNLNLGFFEMAFPRLAAFFLPWIIIFAIPKLQFGFYGQIEGQITFLHAICSILLVNLYIIFFRNRNYLYFLKDPVIYIPLSLAFFVSAFFGDLFSTYLVEPINSIFT